jgi:hypothetical protein
MKNAQIARAIPHHLLPASKALDACAILGMLVQMLPIVWLVQPVLTSKAPAQAHARNVNRVNFRLLWLPLAVEAAPIILTHQLGVIM